ncbi:MAG: nucleotidyltransferase domain-containing protein [Candidatus Margulisbacteria bacterium]|nr:nucleotidyltransferase domain-containing protein [Candidatus Margulisiibacteriota bacterium]
MKTNFNQIKDILQKHPVEIAYLYGSFAEGTPRPWSDIDVALIVDDSNTRQSNLDLEMTISKEIDAVGIVEKHESDVRIINQAPLNYKIQIVQNGKLIYSKNERRRVEFETTVRDEYFDFLPKREEFRKALFSGIKKGGLLWSTQKK